MHYETSCGLNLASGILRLAYVLAFIGGHHTAQGTVEVAL